MIEAMCHCGAVRLEMDSAPAWLNDCNCSACRRYGALWGYYVRGGLRVVSPPEATFAYAWGAKTGAFHHCKTCGCTTHIQSGDKAVCINARMILRLDPATPVRQTDNAHTGVFWTRSAEPPHTGPQPPMADPEKWL